jgi:formyltetrahydrofolate deformylase
MPDSGSTMSSANRPLAASEGAVSHSKPVAPSAILTVSCPDTTGIVAAVAGFLASNNCLITEAQHYDDPYANMSFMRTVFHDNGHGAPPLESLHVQFGQTVAERFHMQWRFHEAQRKCRVVIAVSKQGHCLNSMLHRWSTGTLPIEVVAVVSNHQALRSLTEWHGVPYHYLPVLDGRKQEQERRIVDLFQSVDAELLVLARYMQVLSGEACKVFAERAINIHHSFLPGFKGAKAYHQAHARGVKLIGATAHYVTTDLDEGPILEQEVARVEHTMSPDDLVSIGADLESVVLNRAVKWHAERRVFTNGAKTVVLK